MCARPTVAPPGARRVPDAAAKSFAWTSVAVTAARKPRELPAKI
jgi:hypothetical protein